MSLVDIVDNSTTDKNTTHSYLRVYDCLFSSLREKAENVLEIGIEKGGSLKLWADYFINAHVFGVDKIPYFTTDKRITTFQNDAYSVEFVNGLKVKFDILIDDGSHKLEDMKFFIKHYSPLLKENGVLVVEDIPNDQWIKELRSVTPEHLLRYAYSIDLRGGKNRYDDLIFVISK